MTGTRRQSAAIAWAVAIVAVCSIPGTDLPELDIQFLDKAAHFAMFAVLAWLWLGVLTMSPASNYVAVVVVGSIFGGLTEIYQGILPWERTPDILDVAANTLGLLGGCVAYAVAQWHTGGNRSDL